jgi:HD-GYP domain-containing protein (c-di-GMP phosphodiesterase class II)
LRGDEIVLETRIITGDSFDAITAQRPYRDPMTIQEAVATMDRERGTAVDEPCLGALRQLFPQLGMAVPT